jgi:hypothetical protein
MNETTQSSITDRGVEQARGMGFREIVRCDGVDLHAVESATDRRMCVDIDEAVAVPLAVTEADIDAAVGTADANDPRAAVTNIVASAATSGRAVTWRRAGRRRAAAL